MVPLFMREVESPVPATPTPPLAPLPSPNKRPRSDSSDDDTPLSRRRPATQTSQPDVEKPTASNPQAGLNGGAKLGVGPPAVPLAFLKPQAARKGSGGRPPSRQPSLSEAPGKRFYTS